MHSVAFGGGAVEFEAGTEAFLDNPALKVKAAFRPAAIDYLHQGHSRPQKK